jgi:hypothetical protein
LVSFKVTFFCLFSPFLSWSRKPDVFVRVLKKSLDEDCVFFFDLLVETRLILVCHTRDYVIDSASVFFHILMMASTLTMVPCYDHIRHHFINPCILFKVWVLEHGLEVTQEDCVLQSFLLVPVPITLVLWKLSEGGLDDFEGKAFGYLVVSKDLFLEILTALTCHLSNTINYYRSALTNLPFNWLLDSLWVSFLIIDLLGFYFKVFSLLS